MDDLAGDVRGVQLVAKPSS